MKVVMYLFLPLRSPYNTLWKIFPSPVWFTAILQIFSSQTTLYQIQARCRSSHFFGFSVLSSIGSIGGRIMEQQARINTVPHTSLTSAWPNRIHHSEKCPCLTSHCLCLIRLHATGGYKEPMGHTQLTVH